MAPIWLWMIAAGVLALLELALPGTFFFLFLAAAAVVAGLSSLLLPGWLPWVVFLASGVAGLLLAPRLARRLTPATPRVPLNVDSLVGKIGIVQEAIDSIHGQGLVKVQGQVWRAVADEPIAAGERVRVRAIEGTRLIVSHYVTWERLVADETEPPQQIWQQRRE
ncbi:MAG: NfeD family protein [Armatimonadetes bacterium]|nr:NfeD family protein [Armatimonadota bacterium]